MDEKIKQQILFILEDDNEVMTAALDPDSDLDEENKQMNRELIKQHNAIIQKVKTGQQLTQEDLRLIKDAKEIHFRDMGNLQEHHQQAIELDRWLDLMTELSAKEAFEILERYLDKDASVPALVYRALHTLWEEITPNDAVSAFDNDGRCLKCGSKVSFADVTDTVVFVGDEIVKRYNGDITNRNCVKCHYPEQYPDYEDYDK